MRVVSRNSTVSGYFSFTFALRYVIAHEATVRDFLSDVHFLDLISGQTYTLDEMRMRKLDCKLCLAGNRSFGGIVRSLMAFERLL